jgi:hypothetical protein
MQDNATVHTARVGKQWFADEAAGMFLMNMPANSPDLSLMANVR